MPAAPIMLLPAAQTLSALRGPGLTRGRTGAVRRVLSRASIYLGLRLPAASCGQPGACAVSGQRRSPKGLAPHWALLRAGLRQPVCHHTAGGLLPHLFTLARLTAGGVFLCHFPSGRPAWVLPSALPYGARAFLDPPPHEASADRERLAHSSTSPAHATHRHSPNPANHAGVPGWGS